MDPIFDTLMQALPEPFSFYGLGEVAPSMAPIEIDEEAEAAVFSLSGEIRGMIAVLFDRDLDTSMYTEMANVLASRVATKLSKDDGLTAIISPPRMMKAPDVLDLVEGHPAVFRAYTHLYQQQMIPVQLVILPYLGPSLGQETANA
jgi:CheY-specific phosphatase CheX